jgi:hypothetical protein
LTPGHSTDDLAGCDPAADQEVDIGVVREFVPRPPSVLNISLRANRAVHDENV